MIFHYLILAPVVWFLRHFVFSLLHYPPVVLFVIPPGSACKSIHTSGYSAALAYFVIPSRDKICVFIAAIAARQAAWQLPKIAARKCPRASTVKRIRPQATGQADHYLANQYSKAPFGHVPLTRRKTCLISLRAVTILLARLRYESWHQTHGCVQSAMFLPVSAVSCKRRLVLTINYIKIINFTNQYPLRTMDTSDETSLFIT